MKKCFASLVFLAVTGIAFGNSPKLSPDLLGIDPNTNVRVIVQYNQTPAVNSISPVSDGSLLGGVVNLVGGILAGNVNLVCNLISAVVYTVPASQLQTFVSDPNVTYVYDAFEFRDAFYIVTEGCHSPLRDLLTWDEFNGWLWIKAIARGLLQAVHYLHTWHYAHQDIHAGNVFTAFTRDDMTEVRAAQFKLGDLGITKVFEELDAKNTLAEWIRPPEAIQPEIFGPLDQRIDIYHLGLLLLQIAHSKELQFTRDEILDGRPREMALQLPAPYNTALEKALRRHVQFRTETAMELWRDLNSPLNSRPVISLPEQVALEPIEDTGLFSPKSIDEETQS